MIDANDMEPQCTDFKAIQMLDGDHLTVTWDVGRRCNYSCTYCPPHRHDNFSGHADMETLKKSGQFVFDYAETMMEFKNNKKININFTGGEPTVNPSFLKFGQWLKDTWKEKYEDQFGLTLTITSNGAFGRKMADNIIDNYGFITVSYHAEAHANLKKKVIENIFYLHSREFPLKVNVMFHAEYWDECIDVCRQLQEADIGYVPRMIGEHEDSKNSYAHQYTEAQLNWMKSFWKDKNGALNNKPVEAKNTVEHAAVSGTEASAVKTEKTEEKKMARELGRPCCGSRTMEVCSTGSCGTKKEGTWEKSTFLEFAKFRGWKCSVNWFFLHIEQQTDTVWHHQTCQARFDGTRGPIGTLSECDKIIDELRTNMKNKTMPIITCPLGPGKHCGCGLCTPKATSNEQFKEVFDRHVDTSIFDNTENY